MKILVISKINGNPSAGLTYSIPKQVLHLSKISDVTWINLNVTYTPEFEKSRSVKFIKSKNISTIRNHIGKYGFDICIFQGVYFKEYLTLAKFLRKKAIPYIIIPRGSLTKSAQNKKRPKKILGNIFGFNKFVGKAAAIQYLSKGEQNDSKGFKTQQEFVVPNGISAKKHHKDTFDFQNKIKGLFIGRADVYHKGIDRVLNTLYSYKEYFLEKNVIINFYVAGSNKELNDIKTLAHNFGLSDIVSINEGIYNDEKEKTILNHDFFILTSRFEGHPMGLLEALSYGLPCYVSQGSNMAEEIVEYNAGACMDCESSTNLIDFINHHEKVFNNMSVNALKLAKTFNHDQISGITIQMIKSILNNQRMT